ncbi:MAG: hypothetical protein HOV83_18195 [Catenulispora sp.]|nr:hypothetical protein [Catenulispora sp.]
MTALTESPLDSLVGSANDPTEEGLGMTIIVAALAAVLAIVNGSNDVAKE